jgi:hypothetical protein
LGSGYIAYCGVFEVDEGNGTVTHIPSIALLPNLIRQRQVRSVTLTGSKLTLHSTGAPGVNGVVVTNVLAWKK